MVEYRQDNLIKIVFDGQDLTDSVFDRCNLDHCSFKNCKMDNATFDRCNCIVCDWEGVNMEVIKFDKSNVITEEPEEPQFDEVVSIEETPIEETSHDEE